MAADETTADEPAEAEEAEESADHLLVVSVPDPEPVVEPEPARAGSWLAAVLLVIVVLLATLLAVEFVHADTGTIADEGWRNNALWAAGMGVVLLGLALGVIGWTLAVATSESTLARAAVVAASFGVVIAVIVIGLADAQGGQVARSSTAPVLAASAETDTTEPDAPLTVEDAVNPEQITSSALPILARTFVFIELTGAGRRLAAAAMGCRPADLTHGDGVTGYAIGGTWAQPLLVVNPPTNDDGDIIFRCHRAVVRLPVDAGIIGAG